MNISNIIQVLDKWNFWNRKINTGFKRKKYLRRIFKLMELPEVIALTGVRRCGKSTIVLQVIQKLIKQGVDPKNTLYVNFEEPGFGTGLDSKFLVKIFDEYLEFFNPKGRVYLFLDEVQVVSDWERFVVSLYDRKENVKIFVTGSSAKLLLSEVSTFLSGRYFSQVVYPLDFEEFLEVNGEKLKQKMIASPKTYNYLKKYLEFGGFPRVVIEKETFTKKLILVEYFNSILEKDILLRHQIKNKRELKELIGFAMSNISNPISSYQIEKDFSISSQNVKRYLNFMDEAFLLQFSTFFSFSVKKQTYNPQKVYAIDTGLRNAASFQFSEDIGKLLENLVFLRLAQKGETVYYSNKKYEIDFLIRSGYQVSKLINVCYFLNKKTLERECRSLEEGLREFKDARAQLIYWKGNPIRHSQIEFVNIVDFLLKN